MLGIVGESGSGKSVTFLGLMGLLPKSARIEGSATRRRRSSSSARRRKMINRVRGQQVAMIFQDPLSALNPVHRIGDQIVEMIRSHQRHAARRQAWERVGRAARHRRHPAARATAPSQYPHEFSGGMRQRVMIAMAIANDPEVLIADEPTTALDVTVQAQILEVLQRVRREMHTAIVLITHDLGVVARVADRVQVMYAGRAAERGDVCPIFDHPSHPYTRGLLSSIPALGRERLSPIPGLAAEHARPAVGLRVPRPLPVRHRRRAPRRCPSWCRSATSPTACIRGRATLVEVRERVVTRRRQRQRRPTVPVRRGHATSSRCSRCAEPKGLRVTKRLVQAVSDVSFSIGRRETLGLVGESGSGKSTLGRCVLQLIEPSAGSVKYQGRRARRAVAASSCGRCAVRCRWCSRTRTRRSIPA